MNRHLLVLIAVSFLFLSWFTALRHYLRTWMAQFHSQPSIAKRKRKNKSHLFLCYPAATTLAEELYQHNGGSIRDMVAPGSI